MAHQPSNPEDCFGTSLWGFGPWPFDGTDADLKVWAYTNVLIPGGPLTVPHPEVTTHPDHDLGLEPDPAAYHPFPAPSTITVDPAIPLMEIEWRALREYGVLDTSPNFATPVPGTVVAVDTLTIPDATDVPGIAPGDRVQLSFNGGETRIFTLSGVVIEADGSATLTTGTPMYAHWVGLTVTLLHRVNTIAATDLSIVWVNAQIPAGYPTPVGACPAHPPGAGYGGIGYQTFDNTDTGYGLGSYGARWFPAPPMDVSGGYGGDPYGFGAYGSSDVMPPKLSSAFSLTGYTIEVFFNEEMDPDDPDLLDPTKYTLTPVVGAPSTVTAVAIEKLGPMDILAGDFIAGVTSVIITHTGTTLGGTYTVQATGMSDLSGNTLLGATVSLLTKGEAPDFSVTPTAGDKLLVEFTEDMLAVGSYHGGAVETIESAGSYKFASSPVYPIEMTVTGVEHPSAGSAKKALLSVIGQTSLTYTPTISPATAIDYKGTQTPEGFGATKTESANLVLTSKVVGSTALLSALASGVVTEQGSYEFADGSGRINATSSFRADLTFDATGTFIKPVGAVVTSIFTFSVGDGVVEFNVDFGWDGTLNLPLIRASSGAGFSQTFTTHDWTTGAHTVSLVRNQKAALATLLWDNHPIFSTALVNLVAPVTPWSAGTKVQFFLPPVLQKVTDLAVTTLLTTATSTVFSGAWNFMHNEAGPAFVGDASLTNDKLKAARGPLVKGWGDGTPADEEDVEVLVNSTAVAIADVNPYLGEITTVIPIPLMPIGQSDVKADYTWLASPTMEIEALNLPGLVLNKFDCPQRGHHDPAAHGDQNQVLPGANFLADPGEPKGAPDTSRYPMGLVLGPISRHTPQFIGHRYMGFEREYSAMLNSPTTMLLNQHPNQSIQEGFEHRPEGESVAYEGLIRPTAASPVWNVVGTDTGAVDFDDEGAAGTYTLIDANSGSYDPDDPQAAYYWRDIDLNFPSTVYVVGRFFLDSDATQVADGVFAGVGMGVHDGHHLYLAGCILTNGVEHVGMLLDADKPAEIESWQLGPLGALSLTSKNTASVLATQVPSDLKAQDRFQIFDGPQAGVYTCSSVVFQTNGTVSLTVSTDFPAHWNTYGNKFPTATFEVLWSSTDTATTFRLELDPDQQVAVLQASGVTTATITTLDGSVASLPPQPAETSLLLPSPQDGQKGQAFWGSLSREATNESVWSFFRYGVVPDVTSIAGHEIVVEAEMNDVPDQDPNHDWMLLGNFGHSEVDVTADALLLKQTSADNARNFAFGYARNEPWFTPDSNFDFTAKFRVESGSGVQDAQMVIQDTMREVRLGTLLYREGVVADPNWRQLVRTSLVSLNGLEVPEDQTGWTSVGVPGLTAPTIDVQEASLVITQDDESTARYGGEITDDGLNYVDLGGRVLEARLRVKASTAAADNSIGVRLTGDFDSAAPKLAGLRFFAGATPFIRVETAGAALVKDYPFDFTDGGKPELHIYRLLLDAENGVVALYIDDDIQLPTMASASFNGGSDVEKCGFGQFGTDATGTIDTDITTTVEWRSVSFQGLARNDHERTLGVLRGSDPDDINDWELPRTDATTAANSRQTGPIIEEMDWRNYMEVRLWRDPTWGVTVLRPDLPLPPFYVPEDPNTPGTGFATQATEPSAGWINVEYVNLPRVPTTFGRAEFGSLRRDNVTQQRWERVRYRLFRSLTDDIRVPEHNVLNYHNVITSGELTEDKGHETVVVQTLDDRRVTLLPTHLYADRIWKVIDGTDIYTSEMFDFYPESQLITLKPDDTGEPRCFGVRLQGTGGFFEKGKFEFTDPAADFTSVIVGDLLKIRFGEAAGSYKIVEVEASSKKVLVATKFPANPAGGDESWSISQASVPVTIVFVPGKPVSSTYLLNQPLLDGITKLNEGTPPLPMSQTSESTREEIWGSQINDPNDLLNEDPNFVLNDPFRTVTFTDDPDSLYEQMSFMEVKEGDEGLISFPCEATILSNTPGFLEAGVGEAIYEVGGAGAAFPNGAGINANLTDTGNKVGAPTGAHLLWFSGTQFWEGAGAMVNTLDGKVVHAVDQGGGMPGKFFFASGGNHHGPVLAGGVVDPLGGTLGPGTTLFYPTYPSLPPRQGGGKIYRRTEWFMRLREVTTGELRGSPVFTPLDESFADQFALMDATSPSEPHLWLVNPDGHSAPNGSAFAVMSGGGDYSRFGPWGGVDSLTPKKDAGGWVVDSPSIGSTVSIEEVATPALYTFTAVAVPSTFEEFAVGPTPAEALRDAINTHPLVRLLVVADVQTLLSGKKMVRVQALVPVTSDNWVRITSSGGDFQVVLVSPNGTLQGGSKLTQSSLLAGGAASYDHTGFHNPLAGMVAQGGSPLPVGAEQHLVLVSA